MPLIWTLLQKIKIPSLLWAVAYLGFELLKDRLVSGTNHWIDDHLLPPAFGAFVLSFIASPWVVPVTLLVLFLGPVLVGEYFRRTKALQIAGTSEPVPLPSEIPIAALPPPEASPSSPPPPRQLTAYEIETKLPVIDAAIVFVRDRMEPTVKDGPRLASNWWDGLVVPQYYPDYQNELIAFRDKIKRDIEEIDEFRQKHQLYQDISNATQPTYWNKVLPPIESMIHAFMFIRAVWQPGVSTDGVNFVMKPYQDAFVEANRLFAGWRAQALNNLMDLRKAISP